MADGKFTDEHQMARCESMARLQSVIGGKWKILILWYVAAYEVQRRADAKARRHIAVNSHKTAARA